VYLTQQSLLRERLHALLLELYPQLDPATVAATLKVEQPPESKFGDYALPLAFELARALRKAPRKIAEEIVAALAQKPIPGFAAFEVAGAGYINARLDRAAFVRDFAKGRMYRRQGLAYILVEHTSINPNKAAHVGHLRNSILGDTFARLLQAQGYPVGVQNYIDNTGVQVADIVVALQHLEGLDLAAVESLMQRLAAEGQRIDYYCWDLYARVSQWYEADPEQKAARRQLRLDTLHAIEHGGNESAAIGDRIATAVLRRHLETMLRLGIEYDFLPRESEILHLHFWEEAFELMKAKGVLYFETEGKNKGCWVMTRPGTGAASELIEQDSESPDEDAKVIVRSNGTVTYVGKDIAYHLWKFGLLKKDFKYKKFLQYPPSPRFEDGRECWISSVESDEFRARFGRAEVIYNVIDARQSDPQSLVKQAIEYLGYTEQAARYTHFSYEMVALTPRCALDLGYQVPEEDLTRPYIEVSGRKGFGVKADDLIDKLIAATQSEVVSRHPELLDEEQAPLAQKTARQIAVGALRYFMLKYTRNTVIAFDFKDALSFEGETGPYLQYAAVRTRSIFRKAETTPEQALAALAALPAASIEPLLSGEEAEAIWAVWLRAGKTALLLDQCIQTAEPAYLARHAFQLAQDFSNFYRRHHILTEEDTAKKTLLLATAAVAQRELIRSLAWLGIDAPEVM
jgi:arginyl-tRNA synthetase